MFFSLLFTSLKFFSSRFLIDVIQKWPSALDLRTQLIFGMISEFQMWRLSGQIGRTQVSYRLVFKPLQATICYPEETQHIISETPGAAIS